MKSEVMMNVMALAVVAALAAPATYASGRDHEPSGGSSANAGALGVGIGIAGAASSSRSAAGAFNATRVNVRNSNDNRSSAHQGQLQGQIQGQANDQVLVYKEAKQDYSDTYKQYVPSVNAVAPPPSAPCYLGIGGSVNGAGFGVGLSGSVYDKECEVRETVRLAQGSSNPETRAKADAVLNNRLDSYLREDEETAAAEDSGGGVWAFQNL